MLHNSIQYLSRSKNHSVTQSTFANPCTQAPGGVDSGFRLVTENPTEIPSWGITLNDTTPLWFFCAQTNPVNHCQAGMVFAINPTPDKTFDAFQVRCFHRMLGRLKLIHPLRLMLRVRTLVLDHHLVLLAPCLSLLGVAFHCPELLPLAPLLRVRVPPTM